MATYGASKHDNDDDLLDYVEDTTNVDRKADSSKSSKKGHYAGIHTVSFRDFVLKEELLRAIGDCGFEHPSEVQQACIPKAVLGSDVVCQAKSGMGKTAVFVLSALHRLQPVDGQVSILVLAHARELVYQIEGEFRRFCMHLPGPVKVEYMIGGRPITHDREVLKSPSTCPHILVGSPGRILALVDEGALKLDHVKVFVLDECDRMLIESDMRSQVQRIFLKTPHDKQVMMFSATLPQSIRDTCRRFCQQPLEVFVDDESKLTLHGLQQYIVRLGEGDKNRKLTELLDALEFNQVIVFVAKIERARALCELLKEVGFPAIALHGKMEQGERIAVFDQFRSAKNARILVSTDLCGRGIDIEGINIVINYDFPENSDQYLHRVNRAARFGSKGLSISFVVTGNGPEARAARLNMTNRMNRASGAGVAVEAKTDEEVLGEVQSRFEVRVPELPDQIDVSSYMTEHL